MKKAILTAFSGFFSVLAFCQPTLAAQQYLDPAERCIDVLQSDGRIDDTMIALWSLGYISKGTNKWRRSNTKNNTFILKHLRKFCNDNPDQAFGDVVEYVVKVLAPKKKNPLDARKTVRKFMEPGADYVKLSAALFPSENDVRTVFGEPLASKLVTFYAKVFKPGMSIRPKAEHSDILVWQTTTGRLKKGDPIIRKFAGGIKKVAPYFIKDVPIARFKFVKSGETLGLSYDSLYHVNGRWVLMPKPWRGLR